MKQLILFCFFGIFFVGCNKKDSTPANPLAEALQSGTWRINNFNLAGIDKTAQFSGATFTFKSNGNVSVTTGTNSYTGSWSYGYVSNPNGSQLTMTIVFTSPPVFADLTASWNANGLFPTNVTLLKISSTGSDFLSFTKN
ncbi:MAG: hypothetical protein ABIP30_07025 [Ferruginibacter sp.]